MLTRWIHRRSRGRWLATIAAFAAPLAIALFNATPSYAGFAVQPSDGVTITSRDPSFLVYVDDGDTMTGVEVSTSPDHNSSGFTSGYVGECGPTIPFGEAHKFSCQLPSYETPLAPGTYYWAYTYWHEACTTFLGYQSCYPQPQFSGPYRFTVAQPVAPVGAGPVSPNAGATVGTMPTLTVHAPAGARIEMYASDSSSQLSDGTPAGLTAFSCTGSTIVETDYLCRPQSEYDLVEGDTYYWWVILTVDGTRWTYPARTFTVSSPPSSGGGGGYGGGSSGAHTIGDAGLLPRSAHFTGTSVMQTRLSAASYALSKLVGTPKSVAVACWNEADWANIGGDSDDGVYQTLAFYQPSMPHWVHLSPGICRSIETVLYHRPVRPTPRQANAVETVTHEMMHALGIANEARAECYGMQLSWLLAYKLGIPYGYSARLARLNLQNYWTRPPEYRNRSLCREGGAWDLLKNEPSPPWHDLGL
jgi:hypothetical protein